MNRTARPLAWCTTLLFLASSAGCSGKGATNPEREVAPGVRWVGRVDESDPAAPKFAWSGSGFVARVSGSNIALKLATQGSSEPVFFQPVVDGVPGARFSMTNGEQTIAVAADLADGEHLVEVYRESEGKFGHTIYRGFSEGALLTPPPRPDRTLEIVGDSISAGYGNLGSEEHPNYGPDPSGGCAFSTETESAYMTYGAIAARALGADASILALSGWGVYRDNGNGRSAVLSSVYENTLGTAAAPRWTFGKPVDAVVVNLGTNDFAQGDPGEAEFKGAFSALLGTIRDKYPEAWVFCMVGPLLWGTGLSQATTYLTAVVEERNAAGDARIKLLYFGQQNSSLGTGCQYHPNVTVHTEMADLVVSELKATLGW